MKMATHDGAYAPTGEGIKDYNSLHMIAVALIVIVALLAILVVKFVAVPAGQATIEKGQELTAAAKDAAVTAEAQKAMVSSDFWRYFIRSREKEGTDVKLEAVPQPPQADRWFLDRFGGRPIKSFKITTVSERGTGVMYALVVKYGKKWIWKESQQAKGRFRPPQD